MGVATDTFRLMYLNLQRIDLEYKIQLITETKMNLTNSQDDLLNTSSDFTSDSVLVKKLAQRKERLHQLEKELDVKMSRYQNRLKMIDTEIESCQSRVDKDISRQFKY